MFRIRFVYNIALRLVSGGKDAFLL